MKNRAQPFHCGIAGKVVGISLRHGGGLREPDRVYVRCEERDCQYVDQNEPPCPLRVDMFADGSDRRITAYLTKHTGTRVCYACLTTEVEVSHDQVRRASWRLKEEPGFTIRPARCGLCHYRRVTIGRAADAALPSNGEQSRSTDAALPSNREQSGSTTPSRDGGAAPASGAASLDPTVRSLEAYLRARPGYSFCAHCLARELKGQPAVMRDAMWALDPEPAFQVRTSQCVSCLLVKRVIRHEEPSTDTTAPRRVIEFLAQAPSALFCPSCIAFAADLPLGDVRRVISEVEGVDEFARREASCTACGRWQPVIGVRGSEEDMSERLEQLGDLLAGHLQHRGLRIDLLSYRTAQGWRPFALVKTSNGALVPRAPAILLGLVATKVEADELAVRHAREWIEKRVS